MTKRKQLSPWSVILWTDEMMTALGLGPHKLWIKDLSDFFSFFFRQPNHPITALQHARRAR